MSRYKLTTNIKSGFTGYHLVDTARRAEAVVYPELGCNCLVFRTTPDSDETVSSDIISEPVDIFVTTENLEGLKDCPFTAGSPILFPFPNRIRDGIYTFEGRTHSMDGLLAKGWDKGAGQAIHGLVGDRVWTVEESGADSEFAFIRSSLQLDSFPDIFQQYPFSCRITVTYTLREGALEMKTEVLNTGSDNLPMGFGIHPWFPVALRPGIKSPDAEISYAERSAARVRVPAAAYWELHGLMPLGKIISVDEEPQKHDMRNFRPLDGLDFDDVFTNVEQDEGGWSEGGLRDIASGLEMYISADREFREWVLYAPLHGRVIALEPYTCTTDAVNLHERGCDAGLITLTPQQNWTGVLLFGLRRITSKP